MVCQIAAPNDALRTFSLGTHAGAAGGRAPAGRHLAAHDQADCPKASRRPETPQADRTARPGARRRLRLDEGRKLAAGAARPQDPARRIVREHLDAENAYTKAIRWPGPKALQAQMFAEMKGRIKEDDSSVPCRTGPWDYYVRYDLGAQHPIHARRPRKGSTDGEQVLLWTRRRCPRASPFFQVRPPSQLAPTTPSTPGPPTSKARSTTTDPRVKDLATGEELGDADREQAMAR